jgi:preprotein translocase subunit SecF
MEFFPVGKTLAFMRIRWWFIGVSIVTVVGSLVALFVPGIVYGTDFKGGTEVEVDFRRDIEPAAVRGVVERAGFAGAEVVRADTKSGGRRFMIRVRDVSGIDPAKQEEISRALCFSENPDALACPAAERPNDVKVSPGGDKIALRYDAAPDLLRIKERIGQIGGIELREGANNPVLANARDHKVEIFLKGQGERILHALKSALGPEVAPDALLRNEWIGPKAGAQLRDSALKSIAVAFVLIMAYIAFRFDLRFAPGAVLAVAHDAIVTVGFLVLLRKELNLTTVAALLTVVGYSTNDKVVIYDRIRENLRKLRGVKFERLIDVSLSETLSRTIITGGPTIISLLAFFFWGTGALKDFALTLVVGVIVGTYSSLYVAVPFTWWLDERFFSRMRPAKPAGVRKKPSAVV